jgi:hypothetical protein
VTRGAKDPNSEFVFAPEKECVEAGCSLCPLTPVSGIAKRYIRGNMTPKRAIVYIQKEKYHAVLRGIK